MGVVPPPTVHLVAGFVQHLPHIPVEGRPPLPKRGTPARAVRPYLLELVIEAIHDWIKNDYIKMRSDALPSETSQIKYISMSPEMCSGMNPFIRS